MAPKSHAPPFGVARDLRLNVAFPKSCPHVVESIERALPAIAVAARNITFSMITRKATPGFSLAMLEEIPNKLYSRVILYVPHLNAAAAPRRIRRKIT